MKAKNRTIIFAISCFAIIAAGIFVLGFTLGEKKNKNLSECAYNFNFINKSLNCENDYTVRKTNLAELRLKLNDYIELSKKSGQSESISIYFRDLHNGPTMGINDDETYFSASLLKLPIALTFFKLKEDENKDIMQRELQFKLTDDYKPMVQNYKPTKSIKSGNNYKIEDLISFSLIYSDNLSNEVLKSTLDKIDNNRLLGKKTLNELGLTVPGENSEDVSTRAYASIFRNLYNASYLNIEDSNKILSLLSQSDFNRGISAGVPEGIKVSNKFGERHFDDKVQLHDCGIVYFPQNPYLICIMTQGKDFKDLEKAISDISRMTYQEMEGRRINK